MKTKNNVQKTILRSLAVVVSFVLISFTVSAQDFWKKLLTNSSFNEIALAMVENTKKPEASTNSEPSTFTLSDAIDETLEMEDWMSNESNFGFSAIQIFDEPENEFNVEDWMLDENLFEVNGEEEESLTLEGWMTSDKVWKI